MTLTVNNMPVEDVEKSGRIRDNGATQDQSLGIVGQLEDLAQTLGSLVGANGTALA